MRAPTAIALLEALRHAVGIAPQLKTDAAWLWIDAYWPPRADRDRPSRPLPAGTDPDHVQGNRLALGVGNDRARSAYTASAFHLLDAHRLAGVAIAHWTGRRPPLPRRRTIAGHQYPPLVDATTRRLHWLLDDRLDIGHAPDRPKLDAHAAAAALITAHADLRSVLRDADGSDETPLQRRCKNCQGPAADGRTECWRCINYRIRKGRPRPVPRNMGAFAARDRRRERGEDHGDNPLPRGRYIDGQWTEAS